MNYESSKRIYNAIRGKKIEVNHACEIGVFLPETSNIIDFINDDQVKDISLVEPNPRLVQKIKEFFRNKTNIKLYPFAIHEYNGMLTLFEAEASTFADGLPSSPALINDQYEKEDAKKLEIECKLFSEVDSGSIDLLSIDTEGCEWYALKTMISRPKVISIETHGKFYTNPFIGEIKNWIRKEGYDVWYKTKSDTVFYKKTLFIISFSERIKLTLMNLYLQLRRAKRIFYLKKYSGNKSRLISQAKR